VPDTVTPPVLLSRLMTFVFASALVVVIVLIATIARMYPLNRTQIFFLTTQPRADLEIRLSSFSPNAENLEAYKLAFIKEYIKARNEIIPNAGVMRRKWSAGDDGAVYMWSTPAVYEEFTKTGMWTAYMNELPGFEFQCPVEFIGISPRVRAENTYAANFRYFCTNSDGQSDGENSTIVVKKDFTIVLKLEFENTIKWTDRLQNPLGIRVSKYEIESGDGDPLDFK
jgi:type IV secretory pathway component VirB8